MKNSMAKTLLCGVLASTFFLVNCQKSPGRPVSAPAAKDDPSSKAKGTVQADCTPELSKAIDTAGKLRVSLAAQIEAEKKKTSLTQAEKDSLTKNANDFHAATEAAVALLAKVNNSCKRPSAADKTKPEVFTSEALRSQSLGLGTEAEKLSGAKNAGADAAKAYVQEQNENGLPANAEYIVSKDLGDVLDKKTSDGGAYFIAGKIISENSKLAASLEDKTATVCIIATAASKLDEKAVVKLVATGSEDAKTKRKKVSVALNTLGENSVGYVLDCVMADGKAADAEFRKALGKHLSVKAKESAVTETEAEKNRRLARAAAIAAANGTGTASGTNIGNYGAGSGGSKAASGDGSKGASSDNTRLASGDASKGVSGDNSRSASGDASKGVSGDNSRSVSGDGSKGVSGDNSRSASGDNSKGAGSKAGASASGSKAAPAAAAPVVKADDEETGFFSNAWSFVKKALTVDYSDKEAFPKGNGTFSFFSSGEADAKTSSNLAAKPAAKPAAAASAASAPIAAPPAAPAAAADDSSNRDATRAGK